MKIFIVAGEPSGDMHGAALMKQLKSLDSTLQFIGIGGKQMQTQGLDSIVPLEQISVVGFFEVVKRLPMFLKLEKQCQKIMIEEEIDCLIPIDYPGLNIKLSKFAKNNNIPVFYYIAPQV